MRCVLLYPLLILLVVVPIQAGSLDPAEKPSAPGFTLKNLLGENASLSDYHGKVVLLNFWATWCAPCRKEMPSMEKLWQTYREQGLVILAVSTDNGGEPRIKNFVRRLNLTFPILLDPDSLASDRYQVSGIPVSFLIDRQGRIAAHVLGSKDWASELAFLQVEGLLRQ
ncbi:MAG: TlpA family protein disulfide reductase [Gammaproteobacteria bacterium]|nr:TlpA family protein disulfide reductase [Gammaproteobacteria bacterium]